MNKNFEEYARYYNLFYGDKDYYAEAETVSNLIKKYGLPEVGTLLNVGCGTGRHDIELAKHGYRVKGIDLSPDMIEIAKQNASNLGIEFEVGDARTFSDGYEYDVVTSLFHVMSYQITNEDLTASFKMINRELKMNGLFVFDAWYGPGVLSEKPEVRIKQVEDESNTFIRHAVPKMYPDENIVDVNYEVLVINKEDRTVHTINETHRMRYLFTPEIKQFLKWNGFELIDCIDCNTLKKTSFDSWTAYFIAKKVAEI